MQLIAEKAERLRIVEVAAEISRDVRVQKDLNNLLAWTRYELIERVARETEDDFSAVIDRVISVAYEDPEGVYKPGLGPRRRFLKKYPLAKEAYDRGKADSAIAGKRRSTDDSVDYHFGNSSNGRAERLYSLEHE